MENEEEQNVDNNHENQEEAINDDVQDIRGQNGRRLRPRRLRIDMRRMNLRLAGGPPASLNVSIIAQQNEQRRDNNRASTANNAHVNVVQAPEPEPEQESEPEPEEVLEPQPEEVLEPEPEEVLEPHPEEVLEPEPEPEPEAGPEPEPPVAEVEQPGPSYHERSDFNRSPTDYVDLTNSPTPSPSPKRARLSHLHSATAEDDAGDSCPICLEPWQTSGFHRLVSLRCGHLFGESCVLRWLDQSMNQNGHRLCSTCKAPATLEDIRVIYAKRVQVIDKAEEKRLMLLLEEERKQKREMANTLMTLTAANKALKTENNSLKSQYAHAQSLINNSQPPNEIIVAPENTRVNYKLYREKQIDISAAKGCRAMVYSKNLTQIIVSQRTNQNVFPGFGVRYIDATDFKTYRFIYVSPRSVRDLCLDREERSLVAACSETHVKMFDIRTRQVVTTFKAENPVWSCCFDGTPQADRLYLGMQNGNIEIFDVRSPNNYLEELQPESDPTPVISVAQVPASVNFLYGGILVCKLQSVWFFEREVDGSWTPTRLNQGENGQVPFTSMRYDVERNSLLLSTRNTAEMPDCRFLFGNLVRMDGVPYFDIKNSYPVSSTMPVMSRPTIINMENTTLIGGFTQGYSTALQLYDTKRNACAHSLPFQSTVFDTCNFTVNGNTFLSALTDSRCHIYKLLKSTE